MPVSPAIRDALKAFYRATGGANWAGNDQWLDSGSECSWERVRCNGAGNEVNELDLGNFGLVGTLPTQIGDLSAYGDLDIQLWENDISGTLPTQFGRLTAGGKMTISLDGNSFSGTLPSELGNWQSDGNAGGAAAAAATRTRIARRRRRGPPSAARSPRRPVARPRARRRAPATRGAIPRT